MKGRGGQHYFQQKQYKPKDVVNTRRSRRKRRYLARCYGLKERLEGAEEVDVEFFAMREKAWGRVLHRGCERGDVKEKILEEVEKNIAQVKD
jgi:NADPH-dependent ferric siderophore reductase